MNLSGRINGSGTLSGQLQNQKGLRGGLSPGQGTGFTKDYEKLGNKPSINDVELIKNRSFSDLGITPMSNLEILEIINRMGE